MLQEKYRPRTLEEIEHVPCTKILAQFDAETFPNLILVGQEGAGKRTLLRAFIKHLFGKESSYMGYTSEIEVSSSKTIEVDILESTEAIEIRVSGHGQNDKKIIQKIAKDISETKTIKNLMSTTSQKKTKLLVISDGENLSQGAQMALRRIMEQGAANFRLILLSTSTSTFIDAFKSRFLTCRVPAMSDLEIEEKLKKIVKEEEKTLSSSLIQKIVQTSKGNMRLSLSLLEISLHTEKPSFTMDWEESIFLLSKNIYISPSIKELIESRKILYSILEMPVPGGEVLSRLLSNLLTKENSIERAKEVAQYGSLFDARLGTGTKDLFHIEAFVARAMSIYSNNK